MQHHWLCRFLHSASLTCCFIVSLPLRQMEMESANPSNFKLLPVVNQILYMIIHYDGVGCPFLHDWMLENCVYSFMWSWVQLPFWNKTHLFPIFMTFDIIVDNRIICVWKTHLWFAPLLYRVNGMSGVCMPGQDQFSHVKDDVIGI